MSGEFDLVDAWEVDKTADKLNTSLFGSGKKRKEKPGSIFSNIREKSWSAVIHDSDDEHYTKKGKKKLKERFRKQRKKQTEGEDETEASSSSEITDPSKKSKREYEEESEISLRIDISNEKTKKKPRTKKKDEKTILDTEEKKVRKRKRSSSEDPEHQNHSTSKKKKTSVLNESADLNESKEEASSESRKKRKNRRKKNNPNKNKYRHLAINAKDATNEGNTNGFVQEESYSQTQDNLNSNKGGKIKGKSTHAQIQNGIESKSHLKSPKKEALSKEQKHSYVTPQKPIEPNTKQMKKAKKKKSADLMMENSNRQFNERKEVRKDNEKEATKGKKEKSQTEKHTLKNRAIKLDRNILKEMLRDSKKNKKSQKSNQIGNNSPEVKSDEIKGKSQKPITPQTKITNRINTEKKDSPALSLWVKASGLAEQARETLSAARFRYLNEQLYTCTGREAKGMFEHDRESFEAYHQGYRNQVARWSVDPLNVIIKQIKDKSESLVIADLGCGEGKLSQSVPQKVLSFDLVSLHKHVVACDMAKVPVPTESVDIAVFCLSLMGTNLSDYIAEANRILKPGGLLKIAEVVSRFRGLSPFIEAVSSQGFSLLNKRDLSQMFYLMDFRKVKAVKKSPGHDKLTLKPCVYKKR